MSGDREGPFSAIRELVFAENLAEFLLTTDQTSRWEAREFGLSGVEGSWGELEGF